MDTLSFVNVLIAEQSCSSVVIIGEVLQCFGHVIQVLLGAGWTIIDFHDL